MLLPLNLKIQFGQSNLFLLLPGGPESKSASQLATFYRFWALKESFVKAEGSGLAWNLQRLRFKVGRSLASISLLE